MRRKPRQLFQPIHHDRSTIFKKKAEFRAYLLGDSDNLEAWKTLAGCDDFTAEEQDEVLKICIGEGAQGFGSFGERPTSHGNLVVLALKTKPNVSQMATLKNAKSNGAFTALVYLSAEDDILSEEEAAFVDSTVHLPLEETTPLGIFQSVALKQVLNLISNGMMLEMKKVFGNRMIDLGLSNNKLIYRSINILRYLAERNSLDMSSISDEDLYEKLIAARDYRKDQEETHHRYVPTPVKIVYTQLQQNVSLFEAIEILQKNGEAIEVYTHST